MITIVLIVHVFIVIALVGVVLLQRSDGGALGIGGGGAAGGFMTGRGAANTLTRATTVLGALFIITSLGLGIFGEKAVDAGEIARELTGDEDTLLAPVDDGEVSAEDLLQGFGTETPPDAESLLNSPVPVDEPADETDADAEEDPAPEEESPQ